MGHEDWFARWREGRTAWHEGKPNAMLSRHVARLGEGTRVLVPLCGKTEDMAFLAARGHRVLGLELVEDAVRAFFAEHQLQPTIENNVYTAGPITIVAGDVFSATAVGGPCDALYDRGALIALDAETRPRYAAHIKTLLAPGAPAIVLTMEYDPAQMSGPPFSVTGDEVRERYGYAELLEELPDERRPFAQEKCWSVVVK
jgi:thiopurine S-methyltransferase